MQGLEVAYGVREPGISNLQYEESVVSTDGAEAKRFILLSSQAERVERAYGYFGEGGGA